MNIPHISRNTIAIFLFLVVVLFGILLAINNIGKQKVSKNIPPQINSPTITPTQGNSEKNPSYKKNVFIPTYAPEKGNGVDLQAPLVTNSIKEIQKLYPFLPYEKTLKTSSNQEVDIIIPDKASQTNLWTLQVNIFGLDYHLTTGDPDYGTMKNSFIYAVSSLYKWMEEKGADPKKMMIIWGDAEFIQNKSQEWLE